MSVDRYRGKPIDELLKQIDTSWQRLMETMTSHPEEEYTSKCDHVGWTALDHLAHVTAWERTVLYPLQGRTRYEGLGITDEQLTLGFDEINELVREQTGGDSYNKVMADARSVHEDVVAAVRQADVDVLWKPSREMSADQREADHDVPFMRFLLGYASSHVDRHREYIEAILSS